MDLANSPRPQPTHGARVLLGLFIVTQLAFLFVINFFGMAEEVQDKLPDSARAVVGTLAPNWPKKEGHFHDGMDRVYQAARRYGMMTGQMQSWSLFAPTVSNQCVFPAMVLRWDEDPLSAPVVSRHLTLVSAGPGWPSVVLAAAGHLQPSPAKTPEQTLAPRVFASLAGADPLQVAVLGSADRELPGGKPPSLLLLRSENEPEDVNHYLRIGKFRLRRYEGSLAMVLREYDNETPAEQRQRWYGRIKEYLNDYGSYYLAFMKFRLEQYRREHPNEPPPKQVILVMRRYVLSKPKELLTPEELVNMEEPYPHITGPFTATVARWQPQVTWSSRYLAIERFNPTKGVFEPVTDGYRGDD